MAWWLLLLLLLWLQPQGHHCANDVHSVYVCCKGVCPVQEDMSLSRSLSPFLLDVYSIKLSPTHQDRSTEWVPAGVRNHQPCTCLTGWLVGWHMQMLPKLARELRFR
uniref:Putative secreted protein n=1 Tax=Anopheles darlingi TaxID=43151 RepID=A0A2M4DG49_ANODA